ncbi:MAG: indolepyruvate ferredoxin oxidoreductase subunit alpha [Pyrobaculum sp.]
MKLLLLGNEALAYGALSEGVAVATAYPGTPSTEILETLEEFRDRFTHWAANEKTAFEIAYGAALAGARALTAMKHVGLNVAADPLHSSAYTGVEGGFLIISADDPSMHSSQNEQDTRWYGLQSFVPVLEPSDPRNAYDLAKAGMRLSEELRHPVLIRSVTRVSHVRAPVDIDPPSPPKWGSFNKDIKRFTLVPAHARERRKALLEKWREVEKISSKFIKVEGSGEKSVVTAGVAYNYVKEAVKKLNIEIKIVKLEMSVPVPPTIRDIVGERAVVVEEGEPVVEIQLRSLGIYTYGKLDGYFPRYGELDTTKTAVGLAKAFGIEYRISKVFRPEAEPPPRRPSLCPGCPHMGTFYALRIAAVGKEVVWSGDIGCYSLGVNTNQQDIITHMGSSIGLGMGVALSDKKLVVATVGDSTFFHASLPQLVDVATRSIPLLIVVMDNSYTAMTGGQPSPSRKIPIEKITEAFGITTYVIDPIDIKKSIYTLKKAIEEVKNNKPIVVVSKRPCVLMAVRKARKSGVHWPRYRVDPDLCIKCGICFNIGCSAIFKQDDGKAVVDTSLCTGCGVCSEVCPRGAFKYEGDRSAWLDTWLRT